MKKQSAQGKSYQKRQSGFTLIELVIVVAIIAILAAVGLATFTNTQKSARDSRRRSDLKAMQNAMEQYYAKNNAYPTEGPVGATSLYNNGIAPTDPGSNTYAVSGLSTSGYTVTATLENPVVTVIMKNLQ